MMNLRRSIVVGTCALLLVAQALPASAESSVPSLSRTEGPPGAVVTAEARDWTGCSSMSVNGWGQLLGTTSIDATGRFSLTFTVPASAPTGPAQLQFSPVCAHSTWMPFLTFTVTSGGGPAADLAPTGITTDDDSPSPGTRIHFDAGVDNLGSRETSVFNIKWFVNGREVGAYGSHAGVPGQTRVMDGNSQFDWTFDAPGRYTVTFAVDVDNHVAESDENNNARSVTLTVGAGDGSVDLALPWPRTETWYYTGGPHFDGLSGSVRYAVDFAPRQGGPCPGTATPTERWVVAAAAGTVVRADDSIVEIEHEPGGLRTGYMHLDNVEVQVEDHVTPGAPLGNPSCKVSRGGRTDGVHLHFYLKRGEQPIPVDGVTLSGWTVHGATRNYDGTMTRAGSTPARTADVRRCDSASACAGIRNDIPAP